MDTGNGTFKTIEAESEGKLATMKAALEERYPNHGGWFRVGEEVEIHGSLFRVKSVKPTELRLKLLKRNV